MELRYTAEPQIGGRRHPQAEREREGIERRSESALVPTRERRYAHMNHLPCDVPSAQRAAAFIIRLHGPAAAPGQPDERDGRRGPVPHTVRHRGAHRAPPADGGTHMT